VRKLLGILSFVFLMCLPAAAQNQQAIRVKCGGAALTDSKGQVWAADFGFDGGLVSQTTGAVSGTVDAELFQGGRTVPDSGTLHYNFPVANGSYHVNLYFAELNSGDYSKGARLFNVSVQGTTFLSNFDIFATAGPATALIKGEDITVSNGAVALEFDTVPGHDRGKIIAIEIVPGTSASAPQLALNFVYSDGTPVAGTLNYTVTASQMKIGGNTPLVNGQATAVLYGAPQILGLAGQIQVSLSLTDTSGHILWQIGMTLDSTNANIGGVQSSALSVVVQKP
jgi:Malectin domain